MKTKLQQKKTQTKNVCVWVFFFHPEANGESTGQ